MKERREMTGISTIHKALMLFIFIALSLTLSVSAPEAADHPVEVKGMPICSNCHDDGKAALDHSAGYIQRHRYLAAQQSRVCESCHKVSFCADCHAVSEEMKPGDKFGGSPDRIFPHRGDYITRHKIDGRINPALCFKCHGRKNNARCRQCHI